MDEYNAHDFFSVNPEFEVLICQKCECAVRPGQVQAHLTSTVHRIPRSAAQYIQSVVQQWDHIAEPLNPDAWPRAIDDPVPGIPVYRDGLLCLRCQVYICREIKGLKRHWRKEHDYRIQPSTGRPTPSKQQAIQGVIADNSRSVHCQRLFTQGPGSHYIRVSPLADAAPEPVADIDSVDRLMQQVREYQQQDQQAHETIIQAGDLDEATPWLNRTGWVQYLQGTPREPLVQSIARPEDDAEGPERAALAIWEAMVRLAKVSQDVAKSCGHLLRIDIARTMKDESPHSPLLAYLNAAGIQKHVEPWQQILMFFARTQVCLSTIGFGVRVLIYIYPPYPPNPITTAQVDVLGQPQLAIPGVQIHAPATAFMGYCMAACPKPAGQPRSHGPGGVGAGAI